MQNHFLNTTDLKLRDYGMAVRSASGLISPRQILFMLFRYKVLLVTTFLVVMAITLAIGLGLPSRYKSSMKILVKNERADVIVSPEETTSVDRLAVREETINSEIELLRSQDLLQDVVIKCRLDDLKAKATPATPATPDGERAASDPAAVERAVIQLAGDLEITPVKKADIIEVVYSSKDPQLPAAVLQRMAESYLEKHLRTRHTSGAYQFFKAQSDEYQQQMQGAKARLTAMRERLRLVDLNEQKKLNLTKLVDLESARLKAEAEFQDNLNRVAQLRQALTAMSPRVKTQVRELANQYSSERLNTLLVELRNRRTQLLTKFPSEDRLVKEIDQQIRDTQAALDLALKSKESEEFTDINPVRPPLESELARLEAGVAGLRAQKNEMAAQLNGYRSQLAQLEGVTVQHQELERSVKEAEDNYKLYSRKAEESRVTDALDQKKIANVAIAEAPVAPLLPYRPNRFLILALGCLMAVMVSLSVAFIADYLSDTVHSPEELEAFTGLPVFSTVPLLGPMELRHELGRRAFSDPRALGKGGGS